MKIKVTADYYGNFISEFGTELDVPEEQANRWIRIEKEYREFQNETDEAFKKIIESKK